MRKRPMHGGSMNNGGHHHNRNNNRNNNNRRFSRGPQSHHPDDDLGGRSYKQVAAARDKYLTLAREALSSGDRVQSEYYLQHADHYFRLMRLAQGPDQPMQQTQHGQPQDQDGQMQSSGEPGSEAAPESFDGQQPQPQQQVQQHRQHRQPRHHQQNRQRSYQQDGDTQGDSSVTPLRPVAAREDGNINGNTAETAAPRSARSNSISSSNMPAFLREPLPVKAGEEDRPETDKPL